MLVVSVAAVVNGIFCMAISRALIAVFSIAESNKRIVELLERTAENKGAAGGD